jgi:hypothetical protein
MDIIARLSHRIDIQHNGFYLGNEMHRALLYRASRRQLSLSLSRNFSFFFFFLLSHALLLWKQFLFLFSLLSHPERKMQHHKRYLNRTFPYFFLMCARTHLLHTRAHTHTRERERERDVSCKYKSLIFIMHISLFLQNVYLLRF